jgi:hypothetical protein
MKTNIERYGCLTKVENLWCLEHYGIPNTCLLESLDIFPGYYGAVPTDARPKFVYIIGDGEYFLEEIMRLTKAVKKVYKHQFDAAYAEITMRGKKCNAVRIAGIAAYPMIKELQETYRTLGMKLKKKVRNIENEEAVIKIRKFFNLKVVADDIFIDAGTADIGYFTVENDLPWDKFARNIIVLRNNWNGNSFDAAKSFIYLNGEITDMVRIYSKGLTPVFLREIKDKYCGMFEK